MEPRSAATSSKIFILKATGHAVSFLCRSIPFTVMFPLRFPYFADLEALPHPIPTLDEIECSKELLYEAGGNKVVGVGPYAVKFGRQVDLAEGENMLFVAHTTSVRVPPVYALFRDPLNDKSYIFMERITADTLTSEWPSLSNTQKEVLQRSSGHT
jgi:hypothetical protein